ncbi:MAG: tetratricopeptide repeat protein [Ignavibacteria bacterium]|nr:tetratricopeptide repeat protein [Ignavibacteria bacterium]
MKYTATLVILLCCALSPRAQSQVADEVNTFRLAQVYEGAGKVEDALRYYQDLFRAHPENPGYFDGVRRCLSQLKRYDEAIALLGLRIAARPAEVNLLVQRGSLFMRQGKEKEGLGDWDAATRIAPTNFSVYSAIGDEAVSNKRYDRAVEYLKRGREAVNSPQLFVMEIARAYAMSMNFDKAMEEYLRYLVESPAVVWQVQQQISQFSEIPAALASAQRATRDAAEDHPDNTSIKYLLAWLAMEAKDYDAAHDVYADIDKRRRSNGLELLAFAQRAFNDKAYSAAMRSFTELGNDYPGATFAAEAAFYRARCAEALADESSMPAPLEPDTPTAYPSSEAVTSYRGAIALYEKVVSTFPGQPLASESLFRIAVLKHTRFGDPDGALAILKDLAPKRRNVIGRADAYVLIGDVRLSKGDVPGALAEYQAALGMAQLSQQEKQAVQFKAAELKYFQGDFDGASADLAPLTENSAQDIVNDALELLLFIQQFRQPSEPALARFAQAALLEKQRKYSEAAAVLRSLTAAFPAAPIVDQASLKLADMLRRSGQAADAVKTLDEFLEKNPDSIIRDRALFSLAVTYDEFLRDKTRAMDVYQKVLTEHPGSLLAGKARERILALRKENS